MAVWLKVARQSLRSRARISSAWRRRVGYGLLFGFVTVWAGAAPQAGLSLGERLRLSFNAALFVCLGLAATAGLRRPAGILDDGEIGLGKGDRFLARLLAATAHGAQDLIPALPVFTLLAALQIISPFEFFLSAALVLSVLVAACTILNVKVSIVFILLSVVTFATWRLNYLEKTLCVLVAVHLGLKAFVLWTAIVRTHRLKANLIQEAVTGLDSAEFANLHRRNLRGQFAPVIIALAAVNVLLVAALAMGAQVPATFEQKFAVALALVGAVGLLLLDTSALAWRGLLSGVTTKNVQQSFTGVFGMIIGVPWAIAWLFSALHSGEATTLNEAAAYFFIWAALGAGISWFARASAREKMQRDLRRLLADD